MRYTQRLLHASGAASGIVDVSNQLNDFRSLTYVFPYEAGDYLYVASEVPFNNVWVDVSAPNLVPAEVSVDIWFANGWEPAVDVLDETSAASGNSLGKDGRISFSPNYLKGWDVEQYAKDVDGLNDSIAIYNMYWARLKWDATLTPETALDYIGQKFSNDAQLFELYPDLNNVNLRRSFEVNKASWELQAYIASEQIVKDLISRRIIFSRGQVLDWYMMLEPGCHKTAELIYSGMGLAYQASVQMATKRYKESMEIDRFRVDKNLSGRLDQSEKKASTSFMTR